MHEPETTGQFDYLWEKPAAEPDGFDAFEPSSWVFKPAPTPWYRTKRAVIVLVVVGLAAAALVISGVLLLLRNTFVDDEPSTSDPTTSTSTTSTTVAPEPTLRVGVPPAAPPPPPPPTEEAPQTPVYRPTYQQPRPTKKPEIGVTRTPATRTQISVAPKPRHPKN